MKRSENANYLRYIDHYSRGEYVAARLALSGCLRELRSGPPDRFLESDLLQRLGELFYLERNIDEALRHYQLSEQANPDSLQPLYYFAKFLAKKLEDVPWALAKCDEIIRRATASPIEEIGENRRSEEYIVRALELKAELLSMKR